MTEFDGLTSINSAEHFLLFNIASQYNCFANPGNIEESMIGRMQLLSVDPHRKPVDLDELLGLAQAIEVEAVARYAQLAELMLQRGETETAVVFRDMCEVEKGHVEFVAQRARSLGRELAPAATFTWQLPAELSSSWDEVQHSLLLTPYRALAIAVTNEERAFALYSYLAAQAEAPEVARQAEILALEELAHAAQLRVQRRMRRQTHHKHRTHPERRRTTAPPPETISELRVLDAQLAAQTSGTLNAIGRALEAAGDDASAHLVFAVARREAGVAGNETAGMAPGAAPKAGGEPETLLREALRQLESASETYEEVLAGAEHDDILQAAQTSLQRIVEGISALGHRLSGIGARRENAGT